MEPEIECIECGWQGDISELVSKDLDPDVFNVCPDCGKVDSTGDYEY